MKSQSQNIDKNGKKSKDSFKSTSSLNFPVVGIGASAGGLEALQEFFKNIPSNPGCAFIIIQHLSPDYKSLMHELLARYTSLPIHIVANEMKVEENHIYLIPPKKNIIIMGGKLYLLEQEIGRVLNLPIDIFFRSLAQDQEKNAIGIIMSGTGSDGALGIRAIKEKGGIVMVQDDRSAKFDGMPRSSISTGIVDVIQPPAKLAETLVNYIKHPLINNKKKITESILANEDNQLVKVLMMLKEAKNVDFSHYKENIIIRRLEKRISINRFQNLKEYITYLANNPQELNILFNELLIGVTCFFRDEEAFAFLKNEVIKEMVTKAGVNPIRIWVPGCSTGEEAYSIAMLFYDYLYNNSIKKEVKIFATDIDSYSLEFASNGTYPDSIASDVPYELLSRHFVKKDNRYQVKEHLRSMIIFAKHNILNDPPFSKINLISCRNLLIYLKNEIQQKVLSMFYISLIDDGYLFLGSSESLGNLSDGFEVLNNKAKIYKKQKGFQPLDVRSFGVPQLYKNKSELKSLSSHINKIFHLREKGMGEIFELIISDFIPPSIIIDENYNIVYTFNKINQYFHLPEGQTTLNILKMLPKDLGVAVHGLIRRAEKSNCKIILENPITLDNSNFIVSCKKIFDTTINTNFYLLTFEQINPKETSKKKKKQFKSFDLQKQYQERIEELERELQFKKENLQATIEELETSNEELQSLNEELIASNEELQSTNEELQSVNEELYTVNSEYIKKIDELTELNNDMENLLKNTHIGTIYLDRNLTIRKCNSVASSITNILQSDIGRPITHLSFQNFYSEFIDDIKHVLSTLQSVEKEIKTKDEYYLVRIFPYRTVDNIIDGIIVIFINITQLNKAKTEVKNLSEKLNMAMEIGELSWWEWDIIKDHVTVSDAHYRILSYPPNYIGSKFKDWESIIHPDDLDNFRAELQQHLSGKTNSFSIEYRIKAHNDEYFVFYSRAKIVEYTEKKKPAKMLGFIVNLTQIKKEREKFKNEYEKVTSQLKQSEEKITLLYKTMLEGVVFMNADGVIIDANPSAERILGLNIEQLKGLKYIDLNWKTIRENGSDFPKEEYPISLALKTGKPQKDVIMGVYNIKRNKYVWLQITAIPLFQNNEKKPYMAYVIFTEINKTK